MLTLKAPDASAPISQYIITDPVTFGPNVTGEFFTWGKNEQASKTGIFSQSYTTPNYDFHANTPAGYEAYIGIASSLNRVSSIYTGNGHVYPLSLALNFIIKV